MKHLLWGIALLLATAATAQSQTGNLPVMSMGDPDLYLELTPRKGAPAKPASAAQPAKSDKTCAAERDHLAEYLLHLAAWEACCPEKYLADRKQVYQTGTPLTVEQLEYLLWTRRLRQSTTEK